MPDKYVGMSDDEALLEICKEWGCKVDSNEAQVRLLMARDIMSLKGEIRDADGNMGQY